MSRFRWIHEWMHVDLGPPRVFSSVCVCVCASLFTSCCLIIRQTLYPKKPLYKIRKQPEGSWFHAGVPRGVSTTSQFLLHAGGCSLVLCREIHFSRDGCGLGCETHMFWVREAYNWCKTKPDKPHGGSSVQVFSEWLDIWGNAKCDQR